MRYAEVKTHDIANGPGVRTSLFVSGCNHRCEGCFNEVAWDFSYGREFDLGARADLLATLRDEVVDGLSILGGEPLDPANQAGVATLLIDVKLNFPDKDVWLWTGYEFESIPRIGAEGEFGPTEAILSCVDVIVDGPFVMSLKDPLARFRGSTNQRLIDVRKTLESGSVTLWEDERAYSTHKWAG